MEVKRKKVTTTLNNVCVFNLLQKAYGKSKHELAGVIEGQAE